MTEVADLRTAPQDLDAERAILGSALLYPDAIDEALEILTPGDWFSPRHRIVWDCLVRVRDRGQPLEVPIVAADLTRQESLDDIGGLSYLLDLQSVAVAPSSVEHHARLVRDAAMQRAVIGVARNLLDLASRRVESGEALIDQAEASIHALARPDSQVEIRSAGDLAMDAIGAAERAKRGGTAITGLSSGFPDIDELVGGWQPESMVLLAARPSMGKSTLALNFALRAAITGISALLFSLETSAADIAYQVAANLGRLDSRALRTGKITDDELDRAREAAKDARHLPLLIDDRGELSPSTLRSRLRRHAKEHAPGLVVIDYLQLMHAPASRENRQQEVAAISRAIKSLSREFEVPIIALAQLNRGVEAREDKRPRMSDLRESGSLEQDADVILLLHREDYYAPTEANRNLATCIVAKNRHGRTGEVPLVFLKEQARFESHYGPREVLR